MRFHLRANEIYKHLSIIGKFKILGQKVTDRTEQIVQTLIRLLRSELFVIPSALIVSIFGLFGVFNRNLNLSAMCVCC